MYVGIKVSIMLITIGVLACNQKESSGSSVDEPLVIERSTSKRYGSVIKIKPGMLEEYKDLHAQVWPEVLKQITLSNIRNYSIYLKDDYLFSYFEYIGDDFEGDMKRMAEDSTTQKWWKLTDPCQVPLESRVEGEWWANMEEVFHHD